METNHANKKEVSGAAPVGALKIKQAVKYLGGVSPITVYPVGTLRHLLIPISELDRFLAEGQK